MPLPSHIQPGSPEAREWRRGRRSQFVPELEAEGLEVKQLTPYQFRVNGQLDIYPTNAKWHDLKTGQRGSFYDTNLARFVRAHFLNQQQR